MPPGLGAEPDGRGSSGAWNDTVDATTDGMGPTGGAGARLRVLVCTVVHHPRTRASSIGRSAPCSTPGYAVTYAAPFSAYATQPWPELETIDVPRAVGRSRGEALREARRVLRAHGQARRRRAAP